MPDNVRMLRGNVTVLAAYPEAFANPSAPTAAELNAQFVYSTGEDKMVFNISCAIPDDAFTVDLVDSETDDTRTVCDVGQVQNPTFSNYEISLDGLRDLSVTDAGVFNMFAELFRGVDRPFLIVTRIGKPSTAAFVTTGSDVVSIFGVNTDNPVDIVEDGSLIRHGARFKPSGFVLTNYRVVS